MSEVLRLLALGLWIRSTCARACIEKDLSSSGFESSARLSELLAATSPGPAKVGVREMIALSVGLVRSHLRVLKYEGTSTMAGQRDNLRVRVQKTST